MIYKNANSLFTCGTSPPHIDWIRAKYPTTHSGEYKMAGTKHRPRDGA